MEFRLAEWGGGNVRKDHPHSKKVVGGLIVYYVVFHIIFKFMMLDRYP